MWNRLFKEEDQFCVKQTDTYGCVISCAAMATGGTSQEVIDFIGMDGSEFDPESKHPKKCRGVSETDIYKYLVHHNIYPGFLTASYTNPVIDRVGDHGFIQISIPINDYPALVSVIARDLPEGNIHMIYWDGTRVHDPSPDFCGDLDDYAIVSWTPLIRMDLL